MRTLVLSLLVIVTGCKCATPAGRMDVSFVAQVGVPEQTMQVCLVDDTKSMRCVSMTDFAKIQEAQRSESEKVHERTDL